MPTAHTTKIINSIAHSQLHENPLKAETIDDDLHIEQHTRDEFVSEHKGGRTPLVPPSNKTRIPSMAAIPSERKRVRTPLVPPSNKTRIPSMMVSSPSDEKVEQPVSLKSKKKRRAYRRDHEVDPASNCACLSRSTRPSSGLGWNCCGALSAMFLFAFAALGILSGILILYSLNMFNTSYSQALDEDYFQPGYIEFIDLFLRCSEKVAARAAIGSELYRRDSEELCGRSQAPFIGLIAFTGAVLIVGSVLGISEGCGRCAKCTRIYIPKLSIVGMVLVVMTASVVSLVADFSRFVKCGEYSPAGVKLILGAEDPNFCITSEMYPPMDTASDLVFYLGVLYIASLGALASQTMLVAAHLFCGEGAAGYGPAVNKWEYTPTKKGGRRRGTTSSSSALSEDDFEQYGDLTDKYSSSQQMGTDTDTRHTGRSRV